MRTGDRAYLHQRGLLLEYITLGWNVVGFGIVLWAASTACSVALAGLVVVLYGVKEGLHVWQEA